MAGKGAVHNLQGLPRRTSFRDGLQIAVGTKPTQKYLFSSGKLEFATHTLLVECITVAVVTGGLIVTFHDRKR